MTIPVTGKIMRAGEYSMQRATPSRFGVIAIISTAVVLVLILGLAVFSFLVETAEPTPTELFDEPVLAITPDLVDPALAVSLLAGVSDADVISQAIIKARPGTALATIVFSPRLNANDTAGDLLLIGEKFLDQGNKSHAILSYQLAGSMATLSPELSDTLRADIFMQTGIGLIKAEEPVLAKVYLDQAVLVASDSTHLQAANRNAVFEQANRAYRTLRLDAEARDSLQRSVLSTRPAELPEKPLVLPEPREIALPAHIQDTEAKRWLAAQFLARELVELGGTYREETVEALRIALLAEDEVKLRFYAEAQASATALSDKIDIVLARIDWLSTKYRLGTQGFGMTIVPEWEVGSGLIEANLTASYEELFRLYSDVIVAIPNASDIDRATEEALRRQILAGQLGHFPNYPDEQLKLQLLETSATLIETQPNTDLRVSYLSVNNADIYTLISDQAVLSQ